MCVLPCVLLLIFFTLQFLLLHSILRQHNLLKFLTCLPLNHSLQPHLRPHLLLQFPFHQPKPLPAPSIHPMLTRSKTKQLVTFSPHVLVSNLEPSSVCEALLDSQWVKAMEEEFTALQQNNTWTLVPFSSNMNLVGCKWVYRVKYNVDGSILKYKARLVAKGFHQTLGVDYEATFSPMVKAPTIHVLFSLVVTYGWDIQQVNVNNAFLNGDLAETVYMAQPDGFVDPRFPHHICRLNKSLYGLKQAPRA